MNNPSPRILVYGAGAIGSYIGAVLAESGADVTLLARGAHADAVAAAGGLMFKQAAGVDRHVPIRVRKPGQTAGRYDLVFVTLKSTQIADCAEDLMRVVADDGSLVMVQNGLPWWYFNDLDSPWRNTRLPSLDPDGTLARTMDLRRVIGSSIYRPAELVAPGVLSAAVVSYQKLVLGEIDGRVSERVDRIARLLSGAGFPGEVTRDIRAAKWQKLMVNLVWNPITALTQSAQAHVSAYKPAADLFAVILREGKAVAQSVGVAVELDADTELQRTAKNFKAFPSMLQDVRAGRRLEVDAILNAVVDIAALTGVNIPTLSAVAGLVGLLDERIRSERTGFIAVGPSST